MGNILFQNSKLHLGKIVNVHFNFSLILLHNKSSPQFIHLNCTKCRLSKVIVHEILKTPCGSSRDKESHVFLSECNVDISVHLSRCHLSKCGDVTEAELIMARAGIPGMSATQLTRITICLRHSHSLGRFWRPPKLCQYPGHTGKIISLAGKHIINFQMAVVCLQSVFFSKSHLHECLVIANAKEQ